MDTVSLRLGDVIDDYCPRCKLLLNHAVAGMVEGKVVKVVCQTCHNEHPYKNAIVPPKKRPGPHAVLFEQVLSGTAAGGSGEPAEDATPPIAPPKKRRSQSPARYIARRSARPPRSRR